MLANALFYVALIALAASTFLSAGLAMARISTARLAQSALSAGYQHAASVLQQQLANALASGEPPEALPSFTPLPAQCAGGGNPCRYQTTETIAIAPISTAPTCDPAATNCAIDEEANPYVNERRVAARITVAVTGASGELLVTRSQELILRTFSTPPYVAPAGARDGSFDDAPAGRAAGDDGGAPPATPNPCAGAASAGGTAVRVAYQNAVTGACSDGSGWRNGSYSSGGSTPGWPP